MRCPWVSSEVIRELIRIGCKGSWFAIIVDTDNEIVVLTGLLVGPISAFFYWLRENNFFPH